MFEDFANVDIFDEDIVWRPRKSRSTKMPFLDESKGFTTPGR